MSIMFPFSKFNMFHKLLFSLKKIGLITPTFVRNKKQEHKMYQFPLCNAERYKYLLICYKRKISLPLRLFYSLTICI